MSGSPYYKILGLPETASDAEVKKRFRTLAKQYHPDKNPDANATEIFQKMLDAYERILKKDFSRNSPIDSQNTSSSAAEAQREFHRKAWERYERLKKEQAKELSDFYTTFIQGRKMRLKRGMAIVSFILLSCLVADEFLPLRPFKDKVTSYNATSYQSIGEGYIHEVITEKGPSFFLANYIPQNFEQQPEIIYYQTALCRSNVKVLHKYGGLINKIEIHFTFYWARWLMYILFVFSIGMPFYKKPGVFLVMGSWFSFYIIGAFTLVFLIMNFRVVSILTLGQWP